MKQLINNIYNNAITKVFSKESLSSEGFDNLCYAEMIDETHSIVIWGNEDSDCGEQYRDFIISIRDGAVDTNDGLFGTKEIACDETTDNSHEELYLGIEEKINKYFGIAMKE